MRMRGAPQRRPLLPAHGGNLLTQNIAVDSTETIARKYLYVCILSICDMSHIEKKEAAYQSKQFVLTTDMMYWLLWVQ